MQVGRDLDRFGQRPGAVGIEGDPGLGKPLLEGSDGLGLLLAGQHTALELEVLEAVAGLGGFGEGDDLLRGQGLLVPQSVPVVGRVGVGQVVEVGLRAIADVEQVAEHLDRVPLLALGAEQGRDRQVEELAQQVEQGRLHRGDHVDRGAQVERLQTTPGGVAVGEGGADLLQDLAVVGHLGAEQDGFAVAQRLGDLLPARHLADADPAVGVGQHDQVAGEVRRVRTAQVELHAVVPGNRIDRDFRDGRR